MKKLLITAILSLGAAFYVGAEITIEECVDMAQENYPLIKKQGIIPAIRDIELEDINKGWLPRIGLYWQGTAQNTVPSFPQPLYDVLSQMGQSMKGLGEIQYKAGMDVSQTIWDGGVSAAQREIQRTQAEAQRSAVEVELYTVRQKVENLYFAILLTEEQIEQSRNTVRLIDGNLKKLRSMLLNGTAMQSDVDMAEAQSLVIGQQITQATKAVDGYRSALEILTGTSLEGKQLARPSAGIPTDTASDRPELRRFDNQIAAIKAESRLTDAALRPKVGFFAQMYYGYPGFDYFKSMITRDMSFNILAGVKVTWNIDQLYTKNNKARRIAKEAESIASEKETFILNSEIQKSTQTETINRLRDIMKDDRRIVDLRASIRKAAESQLDNGVIDTTSLLDKITAENQAELTARFHEIQLLQEIYNLKYTLNR